MDAFRKFILSAILTFTIGVAYAQITNVKPPPAVDYAEDAAHVSGARGTLIFGVRNDAGGPLAGTTGDYIPLETDANGRLRVDASVSEVATVANGGALPALIKIIGGYDGANARVVHTDSSGDLQVDVLTSGLPAGASTLAEQQTQSTSLSAIDTGIPAALGQALMASSMPVVLPSDQTVPVSGTFYQATQPVSAVTLPLPSGASTLAEQQTQTTSLSAIDTGIPAALGQALMASSMPVVLPSDQTVAISAASLPLPTGAATSAKQDTGNTSLSSIDGKITAVNTGAVVISSGTITTITNAVPTKAPVNAAGSGSAASATVSTVITLTAPANTAGFVLMNLDTSTANIRWAVGRTATTVLGQQLQAGRDTGFIPSGADISLVAERGTQNYDVQWISQ